MNPASIGEFQNKDVEKLLLNLLILHTDKVKISLPEINKDFFFEPLHQKIFESITETILEGQQLDTVMLAKRAKINSSQLMGIMNEVAMVGSVKQYIKTLGELADKRWLVSYLANLKYDIDSQKILSGVSTDFIKRLKKAEQEKVNAKELIREFEQTQASNLEHLNSGNKFMGIETGYPVLDEAINGIRKGHYWVISAYTNTGKSYFGLNVISKILSQGKRVLLFSLEMSRVQNVARMLGIESRIDPTLIERGDYDDMLAEQINEAKAKLYDSDISIYTAKRHINDIITTIYAEHSTKPVDLIVIDYLQKIRTDDRTRYDRYTHSSDTIQGLCQEIGVPVIMLSQIDNESAKSRNVDIVATKGSGDVAGDVDLALLLQKTDQVDILDCWIQKNRHGKKGQFQLKFCEGGLLSDLII